MSGGLVRSNITVASGTALSRLTGLARVLSREQQRVPPAAVVSGVLTVAVWGWAWLQTMPAEGLPPWFLVHPFWAAPAEAGLEVAPAPLPEPINGDALINATPLGMTGRDCLNCDLSQMPPDGLVFDMVSAPAETPLVAAARQRGLAVVTGLDMLVEQAAASFKLLFGADPPRDRDADLWHRLQP